MKKMLTILGTAMLVVVGTLLVACGSHPHFSENEIVERLSYRQFTPSNEIVEGKYTAVNTLSNYLNKDITVGNDYFAAQMDGLRTYSSDDVCMRYEVSGFVPTLRILYLYKDDTSVVEAMPSDKNLVDGRKLSTSFKDNNGAEAIAWVYDGKATAVFDEKVCPTCTSIWSYDESKNEVKLIWCDSFDCPIWDHYYNS